MQSLRLPIRLDPTSRLLRGMATPLARAPLPRALPLLRPAPAVRLASRGRFRATAASGEGAARPVLRTCKNCKQQYDPSVNHPSACRYHTAHFGGETNIHNPSNSRAWFWQSNHSKYMYNLGPNVLNWFSWGIYKKWTNGLVLWPEDYTDSVNFLFNEFPRVNIGSIFWFRKAKRLAHLVRIGKLFCTIVCTHILSSRSGLSNLNRKTCDFTCNVLLGPSSKLSPPHTIRTLRMKLLDCCCSNLFLSSWDGLATSLARDVCHWNIWTHQILW
jgi:hypothetical protein